MESHHTETREMDRDAAEKGKIRLSKSLSAGEKASVASRREEVKKGLARLGISADVNKMPNIAVLGSGGGLRAMIALYGTLVELKKNNILDCITYLAGVSGSTWCMSSIYKYEDWPQKIEVMEKPQIEKLAQNKWSVIKGIEAVADAADDVNYSLTDFWSYLIVHQLLTEMDEVEFSTHAASAERGQAPYPIYAAVDKNTYDKKTEGTWFEFTPHEVGVPGLGAYVDLRYFGSVFENGQLKEEKQEKNICYMQGLWGSALGSEREIRELLKDSFGLFSNHDRSRHGDVTVVSPFCEAYQRVMELHLHVVDGKEADAIFDHLEKLLNTPKTTKSCEMVRRMRQTWPSSDATKRKNDCIGLGKALESDFGDGSQAISSGNEEAGQLTRRGKRSLKQLTGAASVGYRFLNVMTKTIFCLGKWTWGTINNFLYKCSAVHSPALTEEPTLNLIDAGLAINTAYPLILHPERNVKLILSFDYSAGDPFETLKKTIDYCKMHQIPFPRIDEKELNDTENPRDCYIFRGDNGLTVMHFPLFNKVNCPGEIEEYSNQFSTFKRNYPREEIEKLITAAKKNVVNVRQQIVEEIKRTMGLQQV